MRITDKKEWEIIHLASKYILGPQRSSICFWQSPTFLTDPKIATGWPGNQRLHFAPFCLHLCWQIFCIRRFYILTTRSKIENVKCLPWNIWRKSLTVKKLLAICFKWRDSSENIWNKLFVWGKVNIRAKNES